MPYTMEDYRRDTAREHLHLLSPEERLQGLRPEEIEAVLKKPKSRSGAQVAPKERRETVREYLHTLSAEERLQGLKLEEIEAALKKLKSRGATGRGRPTKKRAPRLRGS